MEDSSPSVGDNWRLGGEVVKGLRCAGIYIRIMRYANVCFEMLCHNFAETFARAQSKWGAGVGCGPLTCAWQPNKPYSIASCSVVFVTLSRPTMRHNI